MPGFPWSESEKKTLKQLVSQGLSARRIKRLGYFDGGGGGVPCERSVMSIQKQMQRMGLVDPARSAIVKADKADAWRGKDRDACIQDLVKAWRTTPVEAFAERWGVSPATIKYLLKQRGLGLSWAEAIRLKSSPFRDPTKRSEWVKTFQGRASERRAQRRRQLVSQATQLFKAEANLARRRCLECQSVFPLGATFFRSSTHHSKTYYSHICLVCSCERSIVSGDKKENLMVRRNRERLLKLRSKLLESQPSPEERVCWKCFRSWPIDRAFFKYSKSKATGETLYEHVCRLCRTERRRKLSRSQR